MKKVRLRKRDISYIRYSTLLFQLEIGLNDGTEYILQYSDVNKGYIIYEEIYRWLFNHNPTEISSIRVNYKYKKSRGYTLNLQNTKNFKIHSPS